MTMRSGWFWGTAMWEEYLKEYSKARPECLHEWKSSPLADDHDFSDCAHVDGVGYERTSHLTQVIDLRVHKWSDVRKSYHSIIHRGQESLSIEEPPYILPFLRMHHFAFGHVRNEKSFVIQNEWIKSGHAMSIVAYKKDVLVAAALWIIYQGCAYYASGPSTEKNTQHAVIWKSLQLLKMRGVTLVELGQIDGETEKEKNIGKFKQGFGGEARPFLIARRA